MSVETAPPAPIPNAPAASAEPAPAAPAPRVDRVAAARAKALAKFAPSTNGAQQSAIAPQDTATAVPAGEPAKPATTAEVKGDPESIATIARQSKELRELKAKMAEYEPKVGSATKWEQAEALVKAGKPHKALEVLGADIDKAVQAHLADDPDATVQEAKDSAAKEMLEIKKRLDAAEEREKARENAVKEAETKAKAAEADKKNEEWAAGMLKADAKGRWKTFSRLETANKDAVNEVQAAARLLMFGENPEKDENGALVPIREPFTDAEANKLMEAALDTLESKAQKLLKQLSGTTEPQGRASTESPSTRAPVERQPSPTIGAERGPTPTAVPSGKGKLTAREAQRRAIERIGQRNGGAN